jgi:ABC-type dipeptide/oligopeptide/nickel transport system permease component
VTDAAQRLTGRHSVPLVWLYIGRRLILGVVTLFALATVVFFAARLTGDPARLMLPLSANADEIAELREHLGFDDPVALQYVRFLGDAMHGDLGESVRYGEPVLAVVLRRLPATFVLTGVVIVGAVLFAIPLGIATARLSRRLTGRLLRALSFALVAIPDFWLALMLILVLALTFPIFPTSGFGSPEFLVLPAITLMARPIGRLSEVTRASVSDELGQDYVRTAVSKGLSSRVIWYRHILKNSMLTIITVVADELMLLLNGAVVVETIFAWPGVGSLAVQAIVNRDFPLVVGIVLVVGAIIILINLASDLAYAMANPRIRLSTSAG